MLRSTSWFYICVVLMLICAGCTQAQHQENTAQRSSVKVNGADRYNSDTYKAASAIQVASSESKHLTDEQLAFLNSHIDDPDNLVRLQVIVALRHASSEQKQAAIAVARKGLKSMDSMTRLYTLTTLDKLDAPDIVSIAKRMSNDRSQYVRPEAERILKKRGA